MRLDGFDEEYRFKRLLKTVLDAVVSYSGPALLKTLPKTPGTPDSMLSALQTLLTPENTHFERILLMVNNLDGR